MSGVLGAEPAAGTTAQTGLAPEEFKNVFRGHPAGVAVVTLFHAGRPVGFTATSVISVSADPPVLAFSLDSASSSWPAVSAAESLVVNFLAEGQRDLSDRFATSGADRFAAGGWNQLPTGEPVLGGVAAWLRARIVHRLPVGSSRLVAAAALQASVRPATAPLLYRDRGYHRLAPADG